MKKRKVIHIYNRAYDAYFPRANDEYYYLAGWSSAIARETVKYTNEYIIENWRPEREIHETQTRFSQGVMCRLFPSVYSRSFGEWSPHMIRELRDQTRKHKVLIHHSSIHNNSLRMLALGFKDIPIIAQHHGDSPPFLRFKRNMRFRSLLSHLIETRILRSIDHFFVLRKSEKEFLLSYVAESQISLQTMGVDFDLFKPIDKDTARRALSIPKNYRVMLYVGRLYRLKGVDIILRVFREIKQKYSIVLLLVGGTRKDELYDEAKGSGARVIGVVPHERLPVYYSAADVYVLPAFSPSYYGIDVAAIESLACGTPIVSTILMDVPTRHRKELGMMPRNEDDVARCILWLLARLSQYRKCREFARGRYEWRNIIRRTIRVYESLFDKYYKSR